MDWDRLIPGHPGSTTASAQSRTQDQLTFLQEVSAAVRAEAREGDAGNLWKVR